jgi:hypothetical protein
MKRRHKVRGPHWFDYISLIVLTAVTLLAAGAKQFAYLHPFSSTDWMLDFMGFFFVAFAMLKLFDLEGFADAFQMYDLIAKHFRVYGYIYPFIELALGLAYLAQWQLPSVYCVTIIVMVWGATGVFWAFNQGLDLSRASVRSALHVPLSCVALIENVGMAAMALIMLLATLALGVS